MSSLVIGLISAGCIFGGALLGLWLRNALPDHHLRDDSKEAIKVGAAMIATLSALVLGLLVSSAKNTLDTMQAEQTADAAKVIVLDRLLRSYGPDSIAIREQLRKNVEIGIQMIWPDEKQAVSGVTAFERSHVMDELVAKLNGLTPATDAQSHFLAEAQSLSSDLRQSKWLLIEQDQSEVPLTFLIVLLFWLTVLHVSFGLFSPRNMTVVTVLFISSLSMAGAIFLIMEMSGPLEGIIKISSRPMRKALSIISQ